MKCAISLILWIALVYYVQYHTSQQLKWFIIGIYRSIGYVCVIIFLLYLVLAGFCVIGNAVHHIVVFLYHRFFRQAAIQQQRRQISWVGG
jgi:uncharacterized membrane protein YcgQ (UPF0703/DUF1980 family)